MMPNSYSRTWGWSELNPRRIIDSTIYWVFALTRYPFVSINSVAEST